MKEQNELKKGLYFVHGYYMRDNENVNAREIFRDQMIIMHDSIDSIYADAYDINLREMRIQNQIPQGEFVYYNGESFHPSESTIYG